MRNVHERHVGASAERVGAVLETLASNDDRLWPGAAWAPMVLDRGLEPGSRGGHDRIRYTVTAHEPGRHVEFAFDPSIGIHGTHALTVLDLGDGTALLRHVLQGRAHGPMLLLWPLLVRWAHDALVEDAFDLAESALGVGPQVRLRRRDGPHRRGPHPATRPLRRRRRTSVFAGRRARGSAQHRARRHGHRGRVDRALAARPFEPTCAGEPCACRPAARPGERDEQRLSVGAPPSRRIRGARQGTPHGRVQMTPLYVLLGVTATTLLLHVMAGGSPARHWPNALRRGLAAMFMLTGASHFVGLREDLIAIVPPALPAPWLLVTVTGALALAGAAGLLWRRSAALSAAGLTALLVAIFPANVYAAVADLQFDAALAADLPLRAGLQVIYLAAAVAVVITHRHVAGAMRLGRLPRPLSVVIPLPEMAGPAGPLATPGIVLISRLQLRRLQDVPGLLRHSLQLRRGFRTVPGAISLQLAASPTRGTFWTWSSWTDELSMDEDVRSGSHRTLMVHYRDRLSEARFEKLRPGETSLPSEWAEARAQVAPWTDAKPAWPGGRAPYGLKCHTGFPDTHVGASSPVTTVRGKSAGQPTRAPASRLRHRRVRSGDRRSAPDQAARHQDRR